MRRLLFLLLAFSALLIADATAADDLTKLTAENTLLRAEYDLARKGQVYLYLDLEQRQCEIRASGLVMATLPIDEVRPWGPLPEPGLQIVAEKDRVPEREKIQIPPPGGEEPAKPAPPPPTDPNAKPEERRFDVQATEVTDMPTSYTLWLEGGGVIVVKSQVEAADWKSRLLQRFERPLWKISHALRASRAAFKNQSYTELTLIMKPREAQRLYWVLPIGSAIILPPRTGT